MLEVMTDTEWYRIFLLIPILYLCIILLTQVFLAIRVWWVFTYDDEINHHYNRKPRVSIIVPAYNEEVTIIDSVESMLSQSYTNFEIIVINDGSKDETFNVLKEKFNLVKSNELTNKLKSRIEEYSDWDTGEFENVYESNENSNIIVINKDNGGKSTALNMGILLSDSEYTLNVDADTLLHKRAISRTLRKKLVDVDAVSCMVGITNGNVFDDKLLDHPQIPDMWLVRRQWLEYLTSFILWRAGNNKHNSITVIPGAYGFIKREALLDVGGYKKKYLAEDGELTLRLLKGGYKIQFITEFLAWTEVPETIKTLEKQRLRWYRGTLQNMIEHRDMVFNKKYSWFLSYFTLPFSWFADIIGSWVELISWLILTLFVIFGVDVNWYYFFGEWLGIILMYSITMSIMLQFVHNKLYPRDHKSKMYRMIPIIFVETFSYHFLNLYWIIRSHFNEYTNEEHNWNKFSRKGFNKNLK